MSRFIAYIKKLIESDSKESSKRFIAIYTMILITFVVLTYTTTKNVEIVLGQLLGFVLVLCGVAVWQSIKKSQNVKNLNKDS